MCVELLTNDTETTMSPTPPQDTNTRVKEDVVVRGPSVLCAVGVRSVGRRPASSHPHPHYPLDLCGHVKRGSYCVHPFPVELDFFRLWSSTSVLLLNLLVNRPFVSHLDLQTKLQSANGKCNYLSFWFGHDKFSGTEDKGDGGGRLVMD